MDRYRFKMNFINVDPLFKTYESSAVECEFIYKGVFDRSIDSIIDTLARGNFPQNLKGNFAFFYKDSRRVVAAVDHLPNYNLFYDNTNVSHIFRVFRNDSSIINETIAQQMNFFWGGSVGTDTNLRGVNRLEAGTYFTKDLTSDIITVESYIDLYTHEYDSSITVSDIADITEQIIEEQTREPFNLLWSSGTDSNCVLGFIRKLNRTDRCQLVSLYSNTSITDERPNIQYLESVYGLQSKYIDLGSYIGITDEVKRRISDPNEQEVYKNNFHRTWYGFWYENNIFQKYTSLYDNNLHTFPTLTGEAGDQLFGSRFGKAIINLLVQKPSATPTEVAELFVSSDIFRFTRSFIRRPKNWIDSLDSQIKRFAAYQSAVDWTENAWTKINCSGDTINNVELLQYLYKASHRAYNYSQLAECNFMHPFGDYRLFHTIFKTPGSWKIKNGKTRRLSLEIIKDFVDDGPWHWPKSGIQMPAQQTSQIKNG